LFYFGAGTTTCSVIAFVAGASRGHNRLLECDAVAVTWQPVAKSWHYISAGAESHFGHPCSYNRFLTEEGYRYSSLFHVTVGKHTYHAALAKYLDALLERAEIHPAPFLVVDVVFLAANLLKVFEGGWMWVLRFENGTTSAGFAVGDRLGQELRLEDGAAASHRFLARFPSIARQFARPPPVVPSVHLPRLR